MAIESMLTTEDNPFDPFTSFNEWFAFDVGHGYHTLQYLANVVITSDDLSEADKLVAQEQGIDDVLEANGPGFYKRVSREIPHSQLVFE